MPVAQHPPLPPLLQTHAPFQHQQTENEGHQKGPKAAIPLPALHAVEAEPGDRPPAAAEHSAAFIGRQPAGRRRRPRRCHCKDVCGGCRGAGAGAAAGRPGPHPPRHAAGGVPPHAAAGRTALRTHSPCPAVTIPFLSLFSLLLVFCVPFPNRRVFECFVWVFWGL